LAVALSGPQETLRNLGSTSDGDSRCARNPGQGFPRLGKELRPGLYTVTFSLPGWSPTTRSAIELTGSFTASVDAELGLAPFVDAVTIIGQASTSSMSAWVKA
jgi:hypothetical protein